ncbi:hypothetical protein RJ641_034680 [Dillenia turbinata]|uniref:Transmembrane protein n=1 Tax=Dillenia turbinata TaxID=194707 RepID=A0AAN8VHW2_9MAGN
MEGDGVLIIVKAWSAFLIAICYWFFIVSKIPKAKFGFILPLFLSPVSVILAGLSQKSKIYHGKGMKERGEDNKRKKDGQRNEGLHRIIRLNQGAGSISKEKRTMGRASKVSGNEGDVVGLPLMSLKSRSVGLKGFSLT